MGIEGFGKVGATKIKDVKRDKTGSVVMETIGSGTVTATATGQANTTTTTWTGTERYFVSMSWSNPRGSGANITLLYDGSVVDSVTNQSEGASGTLGPISFDSTPATPQSVTARFSWTTYGTMYAPKGTITTTQTGVSVTVSTPESGMVASGVMTFTITTGTADVALLQNGSVMTSITAQTGSNTISYSLTAETTSPTLTGRFTWTNLGTGPVDSYTATNRISLTGGATTVESTVLTGTGTKVGIIIHFTDGTATLRFKVNGATFVSTTKAGIPSTYTYSAFTTGTYTSPTLTLSITANNTVTFTTRTYVLSGPKGTASPTLRIRGYSGSASFNVNQIRTKALG